MALRHALSFSAAIALTAAFVAAGTANATTSTDGLRSGDPSRTITLQRVGGIAGFNNKVSITDKGVIVVWSPASTPADPITCQTNDGAYRQIKADIARYGIIGDKLPNNGPARDQLFYTAKHLNKIVDLNDSRVSSLGAALAKDLLNLNGDDPIAAGLCDPYNGN